MKKVTKKSARARASAMFEILDEVEESVDNWPAWKVHHLDQLRAAQERLSWKTKLTVARTIAANGLGAETPCSRLLVHCRD